MNSPLLAEFGEFVLIVLFLSIFISLFQRDGSVFSKNISIILGGVVLLILISSDFWPSFKTTAIYLLALIALAGKGIGSFVIIVNSCILSNRFQIRLIQVAIILVTFALVIILEFADTLVANFIQKNVPLIWWQVGSWILPALGIAQELVKPARKIVNSIFPSGNSRMILFLFVLAAGLLTPLYVPDLIMFMRVAVVVGCTFGLILIIIRIDRSV